MTPHVIYDETNLIEASDELKTRLKYLHKYLTNFLEVSQAPRHPELPHVIPSVARDLLFLNRDRQGADLQSVWSARSVHLHSDF